MLNNRMDEYLLEITKSSVLLAHSISPEFLIHIDPNGKYQEIKIIKIFNENLEFARKYFSPRYIKISDPNFCYGDFVFVIIQLGLSGDLLDILYKNFGHRIPSYITITPVKSERGIFEYEFRAYHHYDQNIRLRSPFEYKRYGFVPQYLMYPNPPHLAYERHRGAKYTYYDGIDERVTEHFIANIFKSPGDW